jgi:hypothetical protein
VDHDELVTVDRFLFVADAEIARAALEASGIDAALADVNISRMSWANVQAHGGIRLQVRREDAARASAVLRGDRLRAFEIELPEIETAPIWNEAGEVCRRCGSEEVYPAESRSRTYARIVAFAILALMLLDLASCATSFIGVGLPAAFLGSAYALLLIGCAGAVVFVSAIPRKRCRNCGLEWRGTPRTA